MVIGHFLRWMQTARVSERAAAAAALARAYIGTSLPFEDRCAAEAALTLVLDDPSSKVRLALADALSMSRRAPVQIVSALASDQPEVAALVLARSPLLSDADLIDRVASGHGTAQCLIAARPGISMSLSAAIAEVGEAEACLALLDNSSAGIASLSFRRMAERLGDVAPLREALLADRRLPPDCRHMLLVKLGEALRTSPLVVALIGAWRAEHVTRDACARASLTLIDDICADEYPALIQHLRIRGDLTSGFLVRTVAYGKIDFFGAVLVALTAQGEARVRALLAGGQDIALSSLFRKAGLAASFHGAILSALKIWREVANGRRSTGVQEVAWLMLHQLNGEQQGSDLASLLKAIHFDALRENARAHALAIAAA